MGFVRLGSDYIKACYTQVDNVFLTSYLPAADGLDVKIYLTGLAFAGSGEERNTLEKMALLLHTDENRILEGFRYWEEKGLVAVTAASPFSVQYLSVKTPLKPIIKINAEKYKTFCDEAVRLFPEKILTPNEYNAYFELMQTYKYETNAVLLIMQYCKDLGEGKLSTPYVLAVAEDWAKQGLTTEKKVSEHITELENNSEDIRQIFRAMGIKRAPALEDRQLYLKWTKKQNFALDAILTAAKGLKKRGGTEKLDETLSELANAGAYKASEIAEYMSDKENRKNLAIELSKILGTYYGSTDGLVEVYVQPWLNLGFEAEALKKLAKFCFLRNIRSFDGLRQTVERFYKKGIISDGGIDDYVKRQLQIDEYLREVFEKASYFGTITNRDRENYRTWTEWGFSKEAIFAVAESCAGQAFPLQAINRTLAAFRSEGVTDEEKIKEKLAEKTAFSKKGQGKEEKDYLKHAYSEEQLKSVLVNFDDWVD